MVAKSAEILLSHPFVSLTVASRRRRRLTSLSQLHHRRSVLSCLDPYHRLARESNPLGLLLFSVSLIVFFFS